MRGRRERTNGVRGEGETSPMGCWTFRNSNRGGRAGGGGGRTRVGVVRVHDLLVEVVDSLAENGHLAGALPFAVPLAVLAHEAEEGVGVLMAREGVLPGGQLSHLGGGRQRDARGAKAQRHQHGARLSLHSRPWRLAMTRAREPWRSLCPRQPTGPGSDLPSVRRT